MPGRFAAARAVQRIRATRYRRALASDERAGTWARGQARRRWYAFVRQRWLLLTSMTLTAAIPITGLAVLISDAFLRGLVVGSGAAAVIAVLCNLVVQATGTAVLSAGATGEQWTAQELRPLLKHGYRLVNRVLVGTGDTDHVLVGPAGVLVVETKWTSHSWTLDERNSYRDHAVEQVDDRAQRLRSWATFRRMAVPPPRPVLFLWSPSGTVPSDGDSSKTLQVGARHTIVWGREAAAAWRNRVLAAPAVLSAAQVEDVTQALVEQTNRQEAAIVGEAKSPPSFVRLYWSLVLAVLAFLGSAVLGLEAVSELSTPLWVGVLLAQAIVGVVAARVGALRVAAIAWFVATSLVAALAAVSAVVSAL